MPHPYVAFGSMHVPIIRNPLAFFDLLVAVYTSGLELRKK